MEALPEIEDEAPDASELERLFDALPDPGPDTVFDDEAALTLENLSPRNCRWPAGLTPGHRLTFCGDTVTPARSFCPAHFKVAYVATPRMTARDIRKVSKL